MQQKDAKIRLQEIIYEFNQDLYKLLKVERRAPIDEIEQAYKNQALQLNKGRGKNDQFFEELTLAY